MLHAIAEGLRGRLPELAVLEVRDNGKPLPEAEWDLQDAIGCFDYYAGLAEGLDASGESVAFLMTGSRPPSHACRWALPAPSFPGTTHC